MEDAQIVDLFFERSEEAIKETAGKYGALCYGVAFGILNSRADAEECVNDTYLGLWNTIPPTRPDNLKNFICRITRNLSLKKLRHNSAHKRTRDLEISLSELEDILPAESGADIDGLSELLSDFLRSISPEARNMFIRKYWFFDPIDKIAEMYGSSEGKVKSSLYRTREKLKRYLSEKGVWI